MKAYLTLAIRVYHTTNMAATTRRTIKTETGNQEDRFAVAIIMRSIDNNKMTVCHLTIPREVNHLLWHGVTGKRWRSPSVKVG